jgi:hypothetical protein
MACGFLVTHNDSEDVEMLEGSLGEWEESDRTRVCVRGWRLRFGGASFLVLALEGCRH